jgi:hypothetical protein
VLPPRPHRRGANVVLLGPELVLVKNKVSGAGERLKG